MITSIRVKTSTKSRINKHGKKGDTYDEILNKILDKILEMQSR